jgi:hypothetical protein
VIIGAGESEGFKDHPEWGMMRGVGGDGEPSDRHKTYHSLSETLHFHAVIKYLM